MIDSPTFELLQKLILSNGDGKEGKLRRVN
jgi:hypothetical protein